MESNDMLPRPRIGLKSLFSSLSLSSHLGLFASLTVATDTPKQPPRSADEKSDEWRVSLASFSLEGYAPGYKTANQDSVLAISSFGGAPGSFLMGVFDGHGRAGHHVSRFISQKLPATLLSMLRDPNHSDHPFLDTFEDLNARMSTANEDAAPGNSCKAPSGTGSHRDGVKKCGGVCGVCRPRCGFDAYNSGSTAVVSYIDPSSSSLVTAWTGDSRACLGVMTQPLSKELVDSNPVVSWRAVDLSNDHKPDRPDERRRITLTGGRVSPSVNKAGQYDGPARVWLADQDYPGLAMSRAMGDLAARPAGIICTPDSSQVDLGSILSRTSKKGRGGVIGGAQQKVRDGAASLFSGLIGRRNPLKGLEGSIRTGRCFVILASDGVWEFMESKEAVDLVAKRLVWTRQPGMDEEQGKEETKKDIWEERKGTLSTSASLNTFPSWNSIFSRRNQGPPNKDLKLTGVTAAQADAACEEACRELVRESLRRWKKEYGGGYIDDISVCIAQLESVES